MSHISAANFWRFSVFCSIAILVFNSVVICTHAEPAPEYFSYTFDPDNSVTQGHLWEWADESYEAQRITIRYGSSSFDMFIIDQADSNLYGYMRMYFRYYSINSGSNQIMFQIDQANTRLIDKINGPIFDFNECGSKSNWLPKSHPSWIEDLVIAPPQIIEKDGNLTLIWSFSYVNFRAFATEDTIDVSDTTNFRCNKTYTFTATNDTAKVKEEIHLSDFHFSPNMLSNPSNVTYSNRHHAGFPCDLGDDDWYINDEVFTFNEPTMLTEIPITSKLSKGAEKISQLEWCPEFRLFNKTGDFNGTKPVKLLASNSYDYMTGHMGLLYEENYNNINFTEVGSIYIDPEISVFYGQKRVNYLTILLIGAVIVAVIAIIVVRNKRKKSPASGGNAAENPIEPS